MGYTWTAPPTWVATDAPTHTEFNEIMENLRFLHTKDRVSVYDSADQSISNATYELMTWDSEDYDNNSMHNNSSNTGRLTAQSDGLYLVEFKLQYATDTNGNRRAQIRKNSGGSSAGGTAQGVWFVTAISSDGTTVSGGRGISLNANDYVELFAYQDSGGALNVASGAAVSWFQMQQITG